jgi:hypothetical protein
MYSFSSPMPLEIRAIASTAGLPVRLAPSPAGVSSPGIWACSGEGTRGVACAAAPGGGGEGAVLDADEDEDVDVGSCVVIGVYALGASGVGKRSPEGVMDALRKRSR